MNLSNEYRVLRNIIKNILDETNKYSTYKYKNEYVEDILYFQDLNYHLKKIEYNMFVYRCTDYQPTLAQTYSLIRKPVGKDIFIELFDEDFYKILLAKADEFFYNKNNKISNFDKKYNI